MSEPSQHISEVTRVVELINNFFDSNGANHDIGFLHSQFVDFIEDTNDRLRRCDSLLRKGLRSEAIQEAELEPSVFDLVAELDTPFWEVWKQEAVDAGFLPQPDLLLDVAADVNEAYNSHQPLEKLLRRHRVYALARSPLSDRIPILRSIARKDSGNEMWANDLKSYEKARFAEIEKELKQHHENESVSEIKRLHREISSDDWSVVPSPTLVQKIDQKYRLLVASNAMQKLELLEPKINDAFSEFNLPKAEQLKSEWERYFAVASGGKKSDLNAHVQPAFEWVEEELAQARNVKSQQEAHAKLEAALDDETVERPELQRLMNECTRFDEPVSDRIERRFDQRLQSFDIRDKRRTLRMVLTSVTLVLVLGGIVAGVLMWRANQNEIANAVTSITRLLDEGKVAEAKTYLTNLESEKPHVNLDPSFAPIRLRIEQMQASETKRLIAFNNLIESARDQGITAAKPNRLGFQNANEDLKEAEKIAIGDSEEVRVMETKRELKKLEAVFQTQVDEDFKRKVKTLEESIVGEKLQAMRENEVDELIAALDSLSFSIGVSQEVRAASQLSLIRRRVTDFKSSRLKRGKQQNALTTLRGSVGDRIRYRRAVESYLQNTAGGSFSTDLKTVLDSNQLEILSAIEDWNLLTSKWNSNIPAIGRKEEAEKRLQLIAEAETNFMFVPGLKPAIENIKPAYEERAKRDIKSSVDSLIKSFEQPIYKFDYLSLPKFGKKYYFLGGPTREDDRGIWVDYSKLLKDITVTEEIRFSKKDLFNFGPPGGKKYHQEAPQTKFAKAAIKYLQEFPKASFEEKICVLLKQLVKDTSGIDEILRRKVILQLLREGKSGSQFLEEELEEFATQVETDSLGVKTSNYLDPDDESVNKIRKKCKTNLAGLPAPFEIYKKRIKPKLESLKTPMFSKLHWLGVPLKSGDELQPVFSKTFDRKLVGDVYVQLQVDNSLFLVGEFNQGKFTWVDKNFVIEGTPLLLMEATGDAE